MTDRAGGLPTTVVSVFTVIIAYTYGRKSHLFYDCTSAKNKEVAVAAIAAKCPHKPDDILVFKGELYDIGSMKP